jgi:iron complex outermembrane receptor protein
LIEHVEAGNGKEERSMKRVLISIGLCLVLALATSPGLAEEKATAKEIQMAKLDKKDYQVYELGEIVVSEEGQGVKDVALTSEVTAEDIERTHSLTVPEALSYSPGITVTTGRKNEPEIRIHGMDQQESLILIDGVPYYETNYGKLNLNQLPTDMIARIDVIKGAPSVLYGSNAMSGVINIITKKQGPEATFSARGEAGTNNSYRLSATHGNSLGKFKYWLNAARKDIDSWEMSDDFTPQPGTIVRRPGGSSEAILEDGGSRNNSDFTQNSFWGKFGVELAPESKYYLSTYYLDSSYGFPPSTKEERVFPNRPSFSGFARMDKYEDWGLDFSGEQRICDTFKLRGKLFYHHHVDDYMSYDGPSYSNPIATSRFKDYMVGGAIYADWELHPKDTLRFALHYRGDSHKERNDTYLPFAEAFSYTGSAAAENTWRPMEALSVVLGVSYDWYDVDKGQANETDRDGNYIGTNDLETPGKMDSFNPMIGATYTFKDNTRIYGSVARKTRFPTLSQLFSSRSGNLDLDPQKSTNYTVGVARPWNDKVFTELSIFYHDIKDRISRDGPEVDALYRNYASVKIWGVEVAGAWNPIKDFSVKLAYTYLNAEDDSDGKVTDKVIGAPEHKVDISIGYTIPKIRTRLDLQGLYLAEQYDQLPTPADPDQEIQKVSGYFLANFRVAQPIGAHVEAFAFVSNIFDKNYESEYGFPGQGRNFWVGVKTMF